MGCIYKIINSVNDKVYIGQTKRTLSARFREHCWNAMNSNYNYPLHNAIRKYGVENFSIELIEKCDNKDLNEREKFWIQEYNSYNNGYNATLGGDGASKLNLDENAICNRYLDVLSINKVAKEFNCSSRTVEQILKVNDVDILSQKDAVTFISGKTVYQIDINTREVIDVFSSTAEAARSIGKKGYENSIAKCCNPNMSDKTCFGYGWVYDINNIPDYNKKGYNHKPVYKINIETNQIIDSFDSIASAAKSISKTASKTMISRCCRGLYKSAYGFKWEYIQE